MKNAEYNFVIKMSKSPIRDYSRLVENIRTTKKDAEYSHSPIQNTRESWERDVKMKLDLALKHNTHLLDENSMLSEMANKLRFELKYVQEQNEILEKSISNREIAGGMDREELMNEVCLLYTSPSPRDKRQSRMPSSA